MGYLFADSEKKVAETLTIVQLMQKHDAEMEQQKNETRKALRRNTKLLNENKRYRRIKYWITGNIQRIEQELANEPDKQLQAKLETYQEILEELK